MNTIIYSLDARHQIYINGRNAFGDNDVMQVKLVCDKIGESKTKID